MRIEKETITIRSARIADAVQLNNWWNDRAVMQHAGFPNGIGQTLNGTIQAIQNWQDIIGQLCLIEIDDRPIGELSYRINSDGVAYTGWKICEVNYQNQGYGPQIIRLLFNYLFTDPTIKNSWPIKRVQWDTLLENKRAQYVYETKLKARKIGIRENVWQDQLGNWRSSVDYAITREEFLVLE